MEKMTKKSLRTAAILFFSSATIFLLVFIVSSIAYNTNIIWFILSITFYIIALNFRNEYKRK